MPDVGGGQRAAVAGNTNRAAGAIPTPPSVPLGLAHRGQRAGVAGETIRAAGAIATPLSVPLVLARCADVLVSDGSAFKFAASMDQVARLTSRRADRAAGGKFITVYPGLDQDRLRDLADALDLATRGLPGPGILSDRRYRQGSLVHYRYGAHRGVPVMGNDGMREAMLIAPD